MPWVQFDRELKWLDGYRATITVRTIEMGFLAPKVIAARFPSLSQVAGPRSCGSTRASPSWNSLAHCCGGKVLLYCLILVLALLLLLWSTTGKSFTSPL